MSDLGRMLYINGITFVILLAVLKMVYPEWDTRTPFPVLFMGLSCLSFVTGVVLLYMAR